MTQARRMTRLEEKLKKALARIDYLEDRLSRRTSQVLVLTTQLIEVKAELAKHGIVMVFDDEPVEDGDVMTSKVTIGLS